MADQLWLMTRIREEEEEDSYGAFTVYGTDRHASVNMPKGREQNRVYLYAAVNQKQK